MSYVPNVTPENLYDQVVQGLLSGKNVTDFQSTINDFVSAQILLSLSHTVLAELVTYARANQLVTDDDGSESRANLLRSFCRLLDLDQQPSIDTHVGCMEGDAFHFPPAA